MKRKPNLNPYITLGQFVAGAMKIKTDSDLLSWSQRIQCWIEASSSYGDDELAKLLAGAKQIVVRGCRREAGMRQV